MYVTIFFTYSYFTEYRKHVLSKGLFLTISLMYFHSLHLDQYQMVRFVPNCNSHLCYQYKHVYQTDIEHGILIIVECASHTTPQ